MEIDPRILAAKGAERDPRSYDVEGPLFRPVRPPPCWFLITEPLSTTRSWGRFVAKRNGVDFQLAKKVVALEASLVSSSASVAVSSSEGIHNDADVLPLTRREATQTNMALRCLDRNPYANKLATSNPAATMVLYKISKQLSVEREDLRLFGEQFGRVVQVRLIPARTRQTDTQQSQQQQLMSNPPSEDEEDESEEKKKKRPKKRTRGPPKHGGYAFMEFSHPGEMERAVREITMFPQKYRLLGSREQQGTRSD